MLSRVWRIESNGGRLDSLNILLFFISCFTSAASAVIGIGGGILLLAAMSLVVPTSSLIPLHGVVQLSSNVSRALTQVSALTWSIVLPFSIGGLLGALLGSFVLPFFDWHYAPPIIGMLILVFTWLPTRTEKDSSTKQFFWGRFFSLGALQTFLSLFVGVTGPLNAPFLVREGLSRDEVVVTHAGQMTALHCIKIFTFGLLGFNYSSHVLMVLCMIAGAVLGSIIGTKLRARIPEAMFRKVLKYVLSVLALRMIWS